MDMQLIPMEKDGETLEVHPSCVADHQRIGWRVAPEPVAEAKPESKPAKGKKE